MLRKELPMTLLQDILSHRTRLRPEKQEAARQSRDDPGTPPATRPTPPKGGAMTSPSLSGGDSGGDGMQLAEGWVVGDSRGEGRGSCSQGANNRSDSRGTGERRPWGEGSVVDNSRGWAGGSCSQGVDREPNSCSPCRRHNVEL